ncbi:MAG: LamG domain-containing protein, partial [Saprospiraceae bacterium]
QYLDFNVQAGEVYTYGVYGLNVFGKGSVGNEIGFVNPNGVITGKVSTVSGNPVPGCAVNLSPSTGTSLQFNGDDNVYVEYKSILPKTQFTVSAWVKLEGTNNNTGIIDFGSTISKNWWMHTTSTADGKGVKFGIGSASPVTLQTVFSNETKDDWHHVAAVYNGASVSLFLDGELINSAPANIEADSIPLYLGQKSVGNGFYNGKIDDVRILNTALSQTELQMTLDKSSSSKTPGLVAYFKMDEGVGIKAFDFSPNRFIAYLCGPVWATDKAPVTSSGITDDKGQYIIEGINYKGGTTFVATASKSFFSNLSLEFNAVNSQWAELTDFDIPDSTTIAISMKPFDLANQQVILSKENGGSKNFVLWLDGNQLKLTMAAETFNFGAIAMGFHLFHFLIEKVGSTTHVTFYNDGNLIGNHDFAGSNADWSGGTKWTLGKKQGVGTAQQFLTGLIDEVVFYKSLLDVPTIQLQNSLGTDPSSSDITSNFSINEGQDTILSDYGEAMTGDGSVHGATWAMSSRTMLKTPHLFLPGNKLVTLNSSSTAVDGIDFVDQSTIPVSGFVRYDGTECFAEGAEILVNGDHARPPAFTDKNGKFIIELEPGQTAKLSTTYKGHTIAPGFWEVRKLASPVAGILFRDKTKRKVSGQLAGGLCRKSILSGNPGDSAIVVLESENGCYSKEFIVKETDGKYVFNNVPPFEMIVGISYHPNPVVLTYMMDQVGGESIDLSDQNDTTDFIFFSEPQLEMTSFDTNACGDAMMVQSEKQTVTMRVFQDYEGGKCYLDSADLRINNFIADAPDILDTTMHGGKIVIKFRAGQPNIVSPYLKTMAVTAIADGYESTFNQQAVVLGKRPRNVNFTSTSPQIPFLILRDPPGDKSFAMLEKNSTTCTTLDFGITAETTIGEKVELKQGFDIAFATGVGFEEETKIEFENTQELETSITLGATFGTSSELCITNHEVFQTDDGDILTGKDADLYVGAAMNMLFGVTDDLKWDTMACNFYVFPGLIVYPDKFATTFIYTDYHIRNTVIPTLNSLQTKADSTSAKQWKTIVDLDSTQKKSAIFKENISFSAGTAYEKSTTASSSESTSFEFAVGLEASLAESMGFEIDGTGAEFSMSMSASLGTSAGTTSTNTKEVTVGYTLGDDDIGDNFTVNIKTDKVYSTPVFETVSGASSCPHEEKTVPRDEVAISAAEVVAVNVPENDAAVFHFTLGNISQTNETRAYVLFSAAESNPLGAVVKANGTNLASPIGYQLPFGEGQEVTVTVERGPGGDFDYDSLEIGLYVECEDDRATALGLGTETIEQGRFYKAIFISAHFVKPCSSVDLSSPLAGWVQTVASGPNRNIAMTGYDKTDPDLDYMLVQYRRTQGNGVWINIEEVPKDNLGPISTVVTWNTTGLSDGQYEIRAV